MRRVISVFRKGAKVKKWLILLILLSIFPFSCQQKQFQVTTIKEQVKNFSEGKIIDVTAVFDKYSKKEIPEFTEGNWAIAVHSYKTGYTYYYDNNNRFLGRKKREI
ncbi:MAG: hypothetical protein JSW17_01810 [Candidatus Omnitrophota bacterium]|nr:MAG: hypothetical protein JSW17_01810 [Candidatus Omnitrophota bacterium]